MEALQKQHSSINQSQKNGQLYANVTIWLDLNEADQNGNNISITLNSSREGEARDLSLFEGKKVYILNGKWPAPKQQQPPLNNGYGNYGGYQQPQQMQQQPNGQQWGQQQQQRPQQNGQYQQQPQQAQTWGQQTQQQQPQPQQNQGWQQQPQQGQQWQQGTQDKLPF